MAEDEKIEETSQGKASAASGKATTPRKRKKKVAETPVLATEKTEGKAEETKEVDVQPEPSLDVYGTYGAEGSNAENPNMETPEPEQAADTPVETQTKPVRKRTRKSAKKVAVEEQPVALEPVESDVEQVADTIAAETAEKTQDAAEEEPSPAPVKKVEVTELILPEPEIPEEEEEEKEENGSRKKSKGFWDSFTRFFKLGRNDASERKSEERKEKEEEESEEQEISTPEGRSLIDEFSNQSIDDAVVDVIKKRSLSSKLKLHPRSGKAVATQPIVDKIASTDRFVVDYDKGLTSDQVLTRNAQGLTNKSKKKYTKSYWEIIRDNVFTFFNIVLFILAIALIVVGRWKDCTFLVIMVLNIIIGLVQEIRSKKMVDKLRLVTSPTATVVRDEMEKKIPVDELVLDDITVLRLGDQISADSTIVEGVIDVNESLLTGESLPIKKKPGDTVYAGSYVVSGSAHARVQAVAEANWAISLQNKAKRMTENKSELLRSMNSIIKVVSIIVLPLAACMFTVNWLNADTITTSSTRISEALGNTAGVVVGMVPAGMFLLTSVALAAGIIRLVKRKTLVQDLYCFEMLARTNVLCLDKTGTLTDGTMEVSEVVVLSKKYDIPTLTGSYLAAFNESNQTAVALAQHYPLNNTYKPVFTVSFSSDRKYSAVTFEGLGSFLLGAPEFVYSGKDPNLLSVIKDRQNNGYRVVMLVSSPMGVSEDGKILGPTAPVALFVLADHIRPEAAQTIDWFQQNDVKIKIISGDNPLTAAEIARTCGVKDADKAISLEGLSLQEVSDIADKYTVFGRVSPEQKAALIKALKNKGNTVSMTGDGVNDILAMKQADCSIAMASGAEAPRNVAHLVLLDSNFDSMPAVVMEGRRVVNNVQRSSALFLMKTIFTIVMAICFIIAGFATLNTAQLVYPFSPSDLLLMEFVGIGVPSFFLSLQPNKARIKGRFLSNTFRSAIPGAITLLITFWTLFIMAQTGVFGSDLTYTSVSVKAVMSICLTFCQLGMLACLAQPYNTYRIVLIIGDFILMLLLILLCNDSVLHLTIFGTINVFPSPEHAEYALNTYEVLTIVIFAFAGPVISSILMGVFNRPSREESAARELNP